MTRYGDALLADGEQVVLRSRQHWLAWLVDGRLALSILVASLVLVFATTYLEQGSVRDAIGIIALVLLVASLVVVARLWLAWRSQDYMVTNRRVVKVDGIIRKRSADSSLEKINDAVLEQGVFGRMFGFGNLEILTAAEIPVDRFYMLAQAQTFKRTMLEEKNRLERDVRMPPSPPLRAMQPVPAATVAAPPPAPPSPAMASAAAINGPGAAAMGGAGAGVGDVAPPEWAEPSAADAAAASATAASAPGAGATVAAPGEPAAESESGPLLRAARHSMSSEEITKLLTDLADLRDRGAISAEDYEAKKQDLLARL